MYSYSYSMRRIYLFSFAILVDLEVLDARVSVVVAITHTLVGRLCFLQYISEYEEYIQSLEGCGCYIRGLSRVWIYGS